MTIQEQLKQIEEELKQYAQRLGQLNLKNNDFLQQNELLALQIVQLRTKVNKKKHIIEQENNDKMIIHQKLVKAEKQKQSLQIQTEPQKQLQNQLNHSINRPTQLKKVQQKENINQQKDQKAKQHEKKTKQQKKQQNAQTFKELKKQQVKKEQQYSNTDKGQYQPPSLFAQQAEDQDEQDEDDQQDGAQILQKLRAKLQENNEDQDD